MRGGASTGISLHAEISQHRIPAASLAPEAWGADTGTGPSSSPQQSRRAAAGPDGGGQDIASWLSLATRSKASVELLIRYWQSSPSVGSRRITS